MKRKWLAGLLVAVLVVSMVQPALGADNEVASQWAMSDLLEAQGIGFFSNEMVMTAQLPVSAKQANDMLTVLSERLGKLGFKKLSTTLPHISEPPTRGQFLDAVALVVGSYEVPEAFMVNGTTAEYMTKIGILKGDTTGNHNLDKPCQMQEAAAFTSRLISSLYNSLNKGAQGLLWKAYDKDTVVYLLGSIHIDNGEVYPFDNRLTEILSQSDKVVLEIDFGNQDGVEYFQKNMYYTDGTKLSDHITPELYAKVKEIFAKMGMAESDYETMRAWVVASTIQNSLISSQKDDQPVVVVDAYAYSKALISGVEVGEIEGYKFQADLLNSMSDQGQDQYVKSAVDSYYAAVEGSDSEVDVINDMMKTWVLGDIAAFEQIYTKDTAEEDEMSKLLFGKRDDHMSDYTKNLLDQDGGQYTIVVGAGHMVGKTGIVQQLIDGGYTVEVVPVS